MISLALGAAAASAYSFFEAKTVFLQVKLKESGHYGFFCGEVN